MESQVTVGRKRAPCRLPHLVFKWGNQVNRMGKLLIYRKQTWDLTRVTFRARSTLQNLGSKHLMMQIVVTELPQFAD